MFMLTDWFARKNVDNTVIFVVLIITGMNQVRLITNNFVLEAYKPSMYLF